MAKHEDRRREVAYRIGKALKFAEARFSAVGHRLPGSPERELSGEFCSSNAFTN
jgi:hypothetical protein